MHVFIEVPCWLLDAEVYPRCLTYTPSQNWCYSWYCSNTVPGKVPWGKDAQSNVWILWRSSGAGSKEHEAPDPRPFSLSGTGFHPVHTKQKSPGDYIRCSMVDLNVYDDVRSFTATTWQVLRHRPRSQFTKLQLQIWALSCMHSLASRFNHV